MDTIIIILNAFRTILGCVLAGRVIYMNKKYNEQPDMMTAIAIILCLS